MIFSYLIKFVSIISKIIFIIIIIKKLPSGVFSEYFFYSTIGLVVGRFFSLAAEDSILNLAKGRIFFEKYFLRSLPVVYLISILSMIFVYSFSYSIFGGLLFSSLIVLTSYISGVYRGRRPWVYEYVSNTPWILATIICFFSDIKTSNNIFLNLGFSYLLLFFPFLINSIFITKFRITFRPFLFLLRKYKFWFYKLIVNVQFLLMLRIYPLYLAFVKDPQADRFSIIFSFGEVLWQIYMVLVNKWYSKYNLYGLNEFFLNLNSLFKTILIMSLVFSSLFFLLIDLSWFKAASCLIGICTFNFSQDILVLLFVSIFSLLAMYKNYYFVVGRVKFFMFLLFILGFISLIFLILFGNNYTYSLIFLIVNFSLILLFLKRATSKI